MPTPRCPKSKRKLEPAQVAKICRAIVAMEPHNADPVAIRALVGEYKFRTLPEIAIAFEVSSNTVNQSWRQNGLPGTSGNYPAAEITAWLCERNSRLRTPDTNVASELEKLELAKKRLEISRLQRREHTEAGQLIDVARGRLEIARTLAILRENLLTIPQSLAPIYGNVGSLEADRIVRLALVQTHEQLGRVSDSREAIAEHVDQLRNKPPDRKGKTK